ncbi:3-hydroxyacyl-CoA dehydrogenase NAD-binding domain-containing protein, partial [Staphylococcus epidermidis]|uniref:3-hydroxyacyl-CoA dehydrogenase NAD-binding domain-containing protein n=1 Tax=Staphylococcus epidermidis TaxID=1282 RepID=UPI0021B3FE9F
MIHLVPQNHQVKEKFYKQLPQLIPQKTYLLTNSSTLTPTHFQPYTPPPKKFPPLHFPNHLSINNTPQLILPHQT